MITLTTDRLLIRNFRAEDVRALREVVIEKEAGEYAVYDFEWPTSEEKIRELVDRFANYDGFLALCERATGELTGFLSFDPTSDAPGQFDLGYCLHPRYQHRGYVTEACRALLDYAFDVLGAVQINSGTAAVNAPSLAVLHRLGMRQVREEIVGFRHRADGSPVEFTGCIFELTGEEWLAHRRERAETQPRGPASA